MNIWWTPNMSDWLYEHLMNTKHVWLDLKLGHIATQMGQIWDFLRSVREPCAKMNRKLILKSPRFVPFGGI